MEVYISCCLLCLLLLLVLLMIMIIILIRSSQSLLLASLRSKNLPPGPRPLPIIGNLLDLGDKPHKSLAKLSETYGPVMSLRLGQVTAIVVSSSTAAKEFLQANDQFFTSRPTPDAVRAYKHSEFGMPWIPASNFWRKLRKISNSQLFSGKVLDANMNLRHAKVQDLLQDVRKSGQTGEVVDIGRAAFRTSLNLLSNTFFSVDLAGPASDMEDGDTARELKETAWSIMEEVGKKNLADYFPFLRKFDPQGIRKRTAFHMKKFMDLFGHFLDPRLPLRVSGTGSKTDKNNDMLDTLINMMISGGESKEDHHLDRNTIEHLLMDLLLAGTETTSSTLEWSMAELLKAPEIMSKAKEELNQVIGEGNQVKESDISRLPYLQAIVKEALRLHPALPLVPRQAESDVKVFGYTVPKGSQVLVNVWAIGRDPSIWDNSPNEFMPERFLDSNIDVRARNFEFMPFGGGRRICPGLPMAMRMLHLMLGSLILSFHWELEDGVSPETMNMDDKFGLTLQRAKPLRAHSKVY